MTNYNELAHPAIDITDRVIRPLRSAYLSASPTEFTYYAAAISQTKVIVLFPRDIGSASTTAADYVITGPSAIATTGVEVFTNYIILTVSGTYTTGTYTLTIASLKVLDTSNNSNYGSANFKKPEPQRPGGSNFNNGFN